jgi:hypothetical protein
VDIERGADLVTGSLEQGMGLPERRCLAGDVPETAQRPQHLAVFRHRVRRPGEDPALACQDRLHVPVGHGNAVLYHLPGEGVLDQGRVHAAIELCGTAADDRLAREAQQAAERRVGAPVAHFAVEEGHGDRCLIEQRVQFAERNKR